MSKLEKVISVRISEKSFDIIDKMADEDQRRIGEMARIIIERWLKEHGYLENEKPGSSQKKASR